MNDHQLAIDAAMVQAESLKKMLKKSSSLQVRANKEQGIIKATAMAWFNNLRPNILKVFSGNELASIDQLYMHMLESSDHATVRADYVNKLKTLKEFLVSLRSQSVLKPQTASVVSDTPPNFAKLISDPQMQAILLGRWNECINCVSAGAPLAATVMMGGLLEALLLARVHRETNKAPIFGASTAPKDKTTGKSLPLQDWMLRNYIDVAHELGWISQTAKDIGVVLRDYRNFVHPYKELSHRVKLNKGDAQILWEVSKSITTQILNNI